MLPLEETDFWNTLLIDRMPVYRNTDKIEFPVTRDILVRGEMTYRTDLRLSEAESELLPDDGAKMNIANMMRDYIFRQLGLSDEEIRKLKDGTFDSYTSYELSPGEMKDEGMLKND